MKSFLIFAITAAVTGLIPVHAIGLHAIVNEITDRNVCELPKEIGRCRAAFTRYYYNTGSGACEEFIYGGCEGNGNNFVSMAACNARCVDNTVTDRPLISLPTNNLPTTNERPKVCCLPRVTRLCFGRKRRYYYDNGRGECVAFIYKGCGSNGNNFVTKRACQRRCVRTPRPVCHLVPDAGPCRSNYVKRYYFDVESGRCKTFIYGRCVGNNNRFNTYSDCASVCIDVAGTIGGGGVGGCGGGNGGAGGNSGGGGVGGGGGVSVGDGVSVGGGVGGGGSSSSGSSSR